MNDHDNVIKFHNAHEMDDAHDSETLDASADRVADAELDHLLSSEIKVSPAMIASSSSFNPTDDQADANHRTLDENPWLSNLDQGKSIRDIAQNERGIRVEIDRSRDELLTDFGKKTLEDRYLLPGESYQDMFARVSMHYADDSAHAQRIYEYISKLWFMPSTPVLSNGGSNRGLPISCFLNEADDSLDGIVGLWTENVWLAAKGGGIGSYWGNLRGLHERVGMNGKSSGVIPFVRVMDSLTLAISQGSLRRGSAAVYLPVDHPEILEFVDVRRPSGGDPNRKALNLNHGIVIPDAFMRAVEKDEEWKLISRVDNHAVSTVSARQLWIKILQARLETGEPYILYVDHINRALPEHHLHAGLKVKTSNLCSEITLPTGKDKWGGDRTAVCCLSSLNLEYFKEWQHEPQIIEDALRFLDNVLQDFIDNAPDEFHRAKYGAMRERSVGLGVMGFHSFLQANKVPLEGAMSKVWNRKIFTHIRTQSDAASIKLGKEKGACPDAEAYGKLDRFSNKIAIAPTASISIICGGASPGIEPIRANSYTHKTMTGSFTVKNKFLKALLSERGADNDEIWASISVNGGSVRHLECLNDFEKDVFKTAFELDQNWLIELAADRTPHICQSQSLNLFLEPNIHKKDLHGLHYKAWKKGIKSLYYCRSRSLQRAEADSETKAFGGAEASAVNIPFAGKIGDPADQQPSGGGIVIDDADDCLSCQ
ncbi:MAG: ribonucleoside-diphosphate reductase subunit alpha [Alphaproteobacteria bacterium]